MSERKGNSTDTYKVYVIKKSAKAMLCCMEDDEEEEHTFWLPYSQIEILDINHKTDVYEVEVPEWLASEKGMV